MAMQAIPATTQLAVAPIEPWPPPPMSWKLVSSGAIVRPCATHQAEPRQTRRPPSVTMNEGTSR